MALGVGKSFLWAQGRFIKLYPQNAHLAVITSITCSFLTSPLGPVPVFHLPFIFFSWYYRLWDVIDKL